MAGIFGVRFPPPGSGLCWWCALGFMAIGCQSIAPVPPVLPTTDVLPAKSATTVDPELADQFAQWLDQDAWQIDLQWSALTLEPTSPPKSRWVFLPAVKSTPSAKDAPATKPAVDDGEKATIVRWNAVWHADAAALEPSDRTAVVQVLHELQARGSRLGANATILRARLMSEVPDRANEIAKLARIANGQYDDADGVKTAVVPAKAPTTTRAAAAEVWCNLLRKHSADPATALAPAGELLQRPGLPDELRMTLWRSLALSLPPDHLPQLSTTLARKWDGTPTGDALKRAALDACIIYAATHSPEITVWDAALWPPQMEALRYDSDPRLRQLFSRWLSLSQHPQAAAWLAAQLRDTQPMVREVALQSLGRLTSDAARQELVKAAERETGRPRALAVQALAAHSVQDVLDYARDPSSDVRVAVARSLINHPSEETALALRPCFSDSSADVAAAALMTAQAWPREYRLPLLLDAIRTGTLATRQSAVFALRELVPDLPDIPIDGVLEDRDRAVQQIARSQNVSLEFWANLPERSRDRTTSSADDDLRIATIVDSLRQYLSAPPQSLAATDAWDRLLLQTTPADINAIERVLAEETGKPVTETVRRELLSRVSPAYAALIDLESREVVHRRRGARALLASTEQVPLSSGLLLRLRELLTYEQDQQVWQSCLAALQPDAHAETGPIVLLAINQMWPDIRRLGLDVVSRHPTPEAAVWLLPLLNDPQRTVRLAAIRAIAACGNPIAVDGFPAATGTAAIPGLRALMTDADDDLRHAAIVSAAVLHDEQALQELMRLSQHPTPTVRDFAAQAMARTGQSRFIDALIRMAWTETVDPVKLSILKSLDTLTPADRRPSELTGLVANASIDDKIKVWARWGEIQRRRAMTNSLGTEAAPSAGETSR